MSRRYRSDNFRATVCAVLATPFALGATVLLSARGDDEGLGAAPEVAVFLPYWPIFTVSYLVWTAVSYRSRSEAELEQIARRESASRSRWWSIALAGRNDAGSFTLAGAVLAVLVTIGIARTPSFGGDPLIVMLGLATVASSWGLMVVSFAQDYLRADVAIRAEGGAPIAFHAEGSSRFGDYVTFAVLASTMAATISADVHARAIWRLVRLNVLMAFGFNSVVVAMVVSLLFGGLAA